MNYIKLFVSVLAISLVLSCEIAPEPISYGKDQCYFCKMGIVDAQHAAQYVTNKGKQFKFDAIECMVNQLEEVGMEEVGILMVSDYGKNKMTDAKTATYLISKEIKSPMGAYLSAFSSKEEAIKTQKEYTGDLYTWEELQKQLARK